MDQWDRFAEGAGQTLADLGWDANVEVYEPTESYTAGDGFDVTYPADPTDTVAGALETPSADADTDPGGTTQTADLAVYVDDDSGVTWTGGGESGEALTRIKIPDTGREYEVASTEPQHDGWLQLNCDEVDT